MQSGFCYSTRSRLPMNQTKKRGFASKCESLRGVHYVLTVSTRARDWWPFEIVIQNRLNVKSIRSPDEPLQDKYRIHLKAANMVRFANEFLKRLRRTSAFVVTIYASINLNGDT